MQNVLEERDFNLPFCKVELYIDFIPKLLHYMVIMADYVKNIIVLYWRVFFFFCILVVSDDYVFTTYTCMASWKFIEVSYSTWLMERLYTLIVYVLKNGNPIYNNNNLWLLNIPRS